MFTLKFENHHDAFQPDGVAESARILRNLAYRLERGDSNWKIKDSNGNTVGAYHIDDSTE
jgi:hypothetical protein